MTEEQFMAEKETVMETEENEVVSKNFIEQEIDKDLASGVYNHVQTRFPAGAQRNICTLDMPSPLLHYGLAQKVTAENSPAVLTTQTPRGRRSSSWNPITRR